jgi:hypothetical protein
MAKWLSDISSFFIMLAALVIVPEENERGPSSMVRHGES